MTDKEGLGKNLFADWRYHADGSPKADFPLNRPEAKGAQVLLVGDNFGCGSSREHAPLALKASGIACVVAENFARIFFRNAINIGLPILECPEAAQATQAGQTLEIDLAQGVIRNMDTGLTFTAQPYPAFMLALIEAGGLIEHTRRQLAAEG